MYDDSTGKGKIQHAQTRFRTLGSFFFLGLCFGLIVAERMYLWSNETSIRQTATHKGRSKKLEVTFDSDGTKMSAEGLGLLEDLRTYLAKIAPSKEVMVAVSNNRLLHEGMLQTFLEGVKQAQVDNFMVLALDTDTEAQVKKLGFNAFYMPIQIAHAQKGTGDNHAVSALKFGILAKFLRLGWSVLLSDVDIAVLQNPMKHLYRDSDVEGMSDGFNPVLAYGSVEGFDDPSMGWARYAQYMKRFNLNSGLFFIRANERTLKMMLQLEARLEKEKYWDQTAFNEAVFFPSHGDYASPQVSLRVMDIYKFMNSKVLWRDVLKRPEAQRGPMPVMVHINYHPDKHPRMKAVFKYYLEGDKGALAKFPGGSEPGS